MVVLCDSLMTNKKIKCLYLRNSQIGLEGCDAVSKLIQSNQTLIELDLFNCGFPEQQGAQIAKALKQNFCIEKLSIGGNLISKHDIDLI